MSIERDTPGARAARRSAHGTAETRRDVAQDALAWQPVDHPEPPHVPSGMTQADVDRRWLHFAAKESLIQAHMPAVEEDDDAEDFESYDEHEEPHDHEVDDWEDTGGYEPGTLAAEADLRSTFLDD